MILTTGATDPVNKILWDESKADRAAGGFTLADTLPTGALFLLKGTPLNVNYTTRVANVVKSSPIVGGTTAAPTIKSSSLVGGHNFKVGDVISDGTVALTISAITAGAVNDTLTFSSGVLTAATPGISLFEAATAQTAAAGAAAVATVEDIIGDYLIATAEKSKTLNWNGVKLQINQNTGDTLAVSFLAGVLLIRLASTTATKNNLALIQAAVTALGTKEGYDLTALTFSVVDWEGKETGGVLNTPSSLFTGGVLQQDISTELEVNALLSDNTKLGGSPTVTAVIGALDVQELNLPYPISAAMKTSLTSRFKFV